METKFEAWLRKRHLKDCYQCKKEGRVRLPDGQAYALWLVKEWEKDGDK